MIKTVAVVLLFTLLSPQLLFAAPSDEVQPPPASESQQAPAASNVDRNARYSPTAEKVYLGTGIGTLVAGGAFIALGAASSNAHEIGSEEAGTVFYAIGGCLLAASTALWILYFREKGREPATSVGLDLDKGRVGLQAKFRF